MSFVASILSLWHSIRPGITGVLVSACLAAFLYWILLPKKLRASGLVFFGFVVLVASDATVWFVLLLFVLTSIAHIAASKPKECEKPYSTPLVIAALAYMIAVMTVLLWGAMWIGGASATLDILNVTLLWKALQVNHSQQVSLLFFLWLTAVNVFVLLIGVVAFLRRAAPASLRLVLRFVAVLSLIGVFIALKLHPLSLPGLVTWVGFSYFAFRLLHVILDSLNDQFTDASLAEMLVYALFFPALLVGPIDRLPRFLTDMRGPSQSFRWGYVIEGISRILIGGVKKFFLADLLLSRLALGSGLSLHQETSFAWVQLYAYAFYIFFDFSGYTDIAVGIGRLLGYTLPENFASPYLKSSITRFWQSWHMTLSSWLRDYVFFPLSRSLLRTSARHSPYSIVFFAHMTTMVLIGLWHGISINFALWGAWHGVGLFIHKVFTDQTRGWQLYWQKHPTMGKIMDGIWGVATFHYVTLSWIFFVIQRPTDSFRFFLRLLGLTSL